jgi:pilus assembly protein Flp/PilA
LEARDETFPHKVDEASVRNEDGTALLEYTVLLGILLVAVIAVIVAVCGWIGKEWTGLNSKLK